MSGFLPSAYSAPDPYAPAYGAFGATAFPAIPGVSLDSGVELNEDMHTFLSALRSKVSTSTVPTIYVTSGIRSASAQASALSKKIAAGSTLNDLFQLYSDDEQVQAIWNARSSVSAMASILQGYMNQGRFMSRHMRGDALDFSGSRHSETQRKAIGEAARSLGAEVVYESKPTHVHVENLDKVARALRSAGSYAVAHPGQAVAAGWGLWVLAAGLTLGGVMLIRKARRG